MLADLVNIERMARIAHHGLGFIGALEFALTVNAEACRRIMAVQPACHGRLRAGLRIDQRHGKARRCFHQHGYDLVGLALTAAVDYQHPRFRRNPYPGGRLLGECHGQQFQLAVFLELLLFLSAWLAAFLNFYLGRLFIHRAL
ncbi:hypothetical protein D3C72_1524230 [compost metagenome]